MDADEPRGSAEQPGGAAGNWVVPTATEPVSALVRLPGSKSMTNRAVVLAALAEGPTQITGPLAARDTALMVAALRALGCGIQTGEDLAGPWLVEPGTGYPGTGHPGTGHPGTGHPGTGHPGTGHPGTGHPGTGHPGTGHPDGGQARSGQADTVLPGTSETEPNLTERSQTGPGPVTASSGRPGYEHAGRAVVVDVGNAGTVLRFVPAIAALTRADVTFVGDARMARRPVWPLLRALRELGAQIDDDGTGTVPFLVRGRGELCGGAVTLDASSSSQLISGLLLAAPRYDKGAEIRHHGPPVPSAPHIEMTVAMLLGRGADVAANCGGDVDDIWRVLPGPIAGGRIDIEPDLSNAAPFLAAALATGGEVTIACWPASSLQPAARILGLLTAMGATVSQTAAGLRVGGSGRIRGITADLSEVGELTPVLTALAALASSPSQFSGIGHLRRHECDRLAALASEIGKLGGDVTELSDGLSVRPRPLRADGVVFDSHDDHRLVMAAAILGLATGGLQVSNAATAGKTFPGFTRFWTQALALAPAG